MRDRSVMRRRQRARGSPRLAIGGCVSQREYTGDWSQVPVVQNSQIGRAHSMATARYEEPVWAPRAAQSASSASYFLRTLRAREACRTPVGGRLVREMLFTSNDRSGFADPARDRSAMCVARTRNEPQAP